MNRLFCESDIILFTGLIYGNVNGPCTQNNMNLNTICLLGMSRPGLPGGPSYYENNYKI